MEKFDYIATLLQKNNEDEARAVANYNALLISIKNIETSSKEEEETQKELIGVVEELISDELNHQQTLLEYYVMLSDIQPKED